MLTCYFHPCEFLHHQIHDTPWERSTLMHVHLHCLVCYQHKSREKERGRYLIYIVVEIVFSIEIDEILHNLMVIYIMWKGLMIFTMVGAYNLCIIGHWNKIHIEQLVWNRALMMFSNWCADKKYFLESAAHVALLVARPPAWWRLLSLHWSTFGCRLLSSYRSSLGLQ